MPLMNLTIGVCRYSNHCGVIVAAVHFVVIALSIWSTSVSAPTVGVFPLDQSWSEMHCIVQVHAITTKRLLK
jgi:hypothetical protein